MIAHVTHCCSQLNKIRALIRLVIYSSTATAVRQRHFTFTFVRNRYWINGNIRLHDDALPTVTAIFVVNGGDDVLYSSVIIYELNRVAIVACQRDKKLLI